MLIEIQFHLVKLPDADAKKINKLFIKCTQIVDLNPIRPNTLRKSQEKNVYMFNITVRNDAKVSRVRA